MRFGLIGFSQGFYARTYTRHLARLKEVEVVACCDLGRSRDYVVECARVTAEEFTEELGCQLVHSLDDLFALNLDAVMVASELCEHAAHTEQALRAGCHVFVGKPVSFQPDEIRSLLNVAAASGKTVLPGNPLRHDSTIEQIAGQVMAGAIGDPTNIRIFIHHTAMLRQEWERDPARSGGPLGTFGIYLIDTLRWMTGQELVDVYATGGNFVFPQIRSWDTVQAMGTTSGGALAQFNLVSTMNWDYPAIVMDLIGTKGIIRTGYDRHSFLLQNPDFAVGQLVNEQLGQKEIEHFVDCYYGRSKPCMTLEDMLPVAVGIEAIGQSIAQGIKIDLAR